MKNKKTGLVLCALGAFLMLTSVTQAAWYNPATWFKKAPTTSIAAPTSVVAPVSPAEDPEAPVSPPAPSSLVRTVTVADPAQAAEIENLTARITQLQGTIDTQTATIALLRTQLAASSAITSTQIVNQPKSKDQLEAEYKVAHVYPDCNNRSLYPVTGHEMGDCDRDITNYYTAMSNWVNGELAAQ